MKVGEVDDLEAVELRIEPFDGYVDFLREKPRAPHEDPVRADDETDDVRLEKDPERNLPIKREADERGEDAWQNRKEARAPMRVVGARPKGSAFCRS